MYDRNRRYNTFSTVIIQRIDDLLLESIEIEYLYLKGLYDMFAGNNQEKYVNILNKIISPLRARLDDLGLDRDLDENNEFLNVLDDYIYQEVETFYFRIARDLLEVDTNVFVDIYDEIKNNELYEFNQQHMTEFFFSDSLNFNYNMNNRNKKSENTIYNLNYVFSSSNLDKEDEIFLDFVRYHNNVFTDEQFEIIFTNRYRQKSARK